MKKVNELKAGALLSYLNLGITCIIPLFYTPVMLDILGQSEYGLYSLSNSVISYLTLLNFGMGSAVVRYIAKYRAEGEIEKIQATVGLFLRIYTCLAVLVCVCGGFLSFNAGSLFSKGLTAPEIQRLKILIVIMTLSTAASFPISVYSNLASAYEKFVFRRIFDLFGTIAAPVLNLVMLFLGKGSIGMACVGLFLQLVYGPVFVLYCRKKIGIRATYQKMSMDIIAEVWSFSAFVFLSSLVDMLYWATDKILLGALAGSVAVAVYNVGGVFTAMVQNMAHAISHVFTPRVTTLAVTEAGTEKISELLIRIGRIQFLIVSFILSGYIAFGQIFIHFWAGDGYQQAYYVALMTMIPIAIPLIQSIAYSTIVAQNKHRFRALVYAVIAVMNVISTALVIPHFGLLGAAMCTCVAFTIGQGVIMNVYYYRVTMLDIPLFWKNIARMSVVPVGMCICGYLVNNVVFAVDSVFAFLILVVVFSVVFWGMTWIFSMNQYEKNLVLDMAAKVIRRGNKEK